MSKERKESMPSSDINPGNSIQRVEECMKYMVVQDWTRFNYLYSKLKDFQEVRIKGAGKMLRDDDEFTTAWNDLRANTVSSLLKNLESATTHQEFMNWMQKLSDIVGNHRTLWNLLHTEVQPSLKVTLEQSKEIAAKFFTPEMLFEFGLESFLASGLCDFTNISNEDELIDIFYAAAGYMRACNLSSKYQVKHTKFIELVNRILLFFINLPEFNAHKFVWLVEAIDKNLHIPHETFKKVCETVLKDYAEKDFGDQSLSRLHKMCIISTSPFLQKLSILQSVINTVFKKVIEEQKRFVNKYIFGCYVNSLWDKDDGVVRLSDALIAWELYVRNLSFRIKEKPELPHQLLIDLIDESLSYFIGYYGEVQPTKQKSVNLRMDIFLIARICAEFYPGKVPEESIRKIWFLLYIAAVSGASDQELNNIQHLKSENNDVFLGLKHTDKEFSDYQMALGRLSTKFENESEAFEPMRKFVRKNYDGVRRDDDDEENEE